MEPLRSDDEENGANGGCCVEQRCGNGSNTEGTTSNEKKEDKGYVQTWENNTTPKMHTPIVRVKAMLEQAKLMDETQEYLQTLQEEIIARRGTLQMCADRSRDAAGYKKKLLYFTQSAPNMMEIQKQCSNGVRNWRHMDTHDWETIPNDKMKKMLLSCITGQPGKR